jgi:hypothetical protein
LPFHLTFFQAPFPSAYYDTAELTLKIPSVLLTRIDAELMMQRENKKFNNVGCCEVQHKSRNTGKINKRAVEKFDLCDAIHYSSLFSSNNDNIHNWIAIVSAAFNGGVSERARDEWQVNKLFLW